MKRVLIFIGLKVAEVGSVGLVVLGVYWMGRVLTLTVGWEHGEGVGQNILIGLLSAVIVYALFVTVFLLGSGIWIIIRANWKKAGELAERGK